MPRPYTDIPRSPRFGLQRRFMGEVSLVWATGTIGDDLWNSRHGRSIWGFGVFVAGHAGTADLRMNVLLFDPVLGPWEQQVSADYCGWRR